MSAPIGEYGCVVTIEDALQQRAHTALYHDEQQAPYQCGQDALELSKGPCGQCEVIKGGEEDSGIESSRKRENSNNTSLVTHTRQTSVRTLRKVTWESLVAFCTSFLYLIVSIICCYR